VLDGRFIGRRSTGAWIRFHDLSAVNASLVTSSDFVLYVGRDSKTVRHRNGSYPNAARDRGLKLRAMGGMGLLLERLERCPGSTQCSIRKRVPEAESGTREIWLLCDFQCLGGGVVVIIEMASTRGRINRSIKDA
jgi:hypothetical protein